MPILPPGLIERCLQGTTLFPLGSLGPLFTNCPNPRSSSRQICLFSISKDTPLQKTTLDTSPSPLIPHFDHDTRYDDETLLI
jgi:hypothetical protein